jgi:hypothetical protein
MIAIRYSLFIICWFLCLLLLLACKCSCSLDFLKQKDTLDLFGQDCCLACSGNLLNILLFHDILEVCIRYYSILPLIHSFLLYYYYLFVLLFICINNCYLYFLLPNFLFHLLSNTFLFLFQFYFLLNFL